MPANGQRDIILEENEVYSDTLGSSEDEETTFLSKTVERTLSSQSEEKPIGFESVTTRRDHEAFLRECLEILLKEAVFEGTSRKNKVVEFRQPEELLKIFDFQLTNDPTTQSAMVKNLRDVVKYSVKTGHPYFVNQLFSSTDAYGLIGQILTDALNPSAYTYEVAPVIILMEETVLREMRKIVGWANGDGDGIFCPGGSLANGYAISCARHYYFPEAKTKGLHSLPKLVLFTSQDAHYSIKKLSAFMGLGTENICLVKTDDRGKMDTDHLEKLIEETIASNAKPFMVSATAGTTVLGAFDPIDKLADICKKYNIWLHVDAAWGGGSLMSKKHRVLLKGVERADSVIWNPHKLLTAPQQCSTFLVRHKNVLADAHSQNAVYLFQKDKFYDTSYDTGDKHIQCGRKADVVKFWFMWKAKGTSGLEKHIDKIYENSKFFLETIRNRPGFELFLPEPECTNICFWYVPESLRPGNFKENMQNKEFTEKLHHVAPKMKEKMMKEGTMMVTYQTQSDKPNFFRIVFQNSSLDKNDMLHLVEEFERLGKDL
ncbi:cysteine sulfinic acid decarboxylase isoform X2 [Anthonomus grandis grandis]|uniref:cysteine sulfinic acid decarboxylase isoform X2 n=1 Tax=Anthonomus grandis grandis TaxID=2921223 RepID=UPI002165E5AB|nr:cysteine sulfinic acid decarboxylase isoform X2 [Anthonomus grandis grandis]